MESADREEVRLVAETILRVGAQVIVAEKQERPVEFEKPVALPLLDQKTRIAELARRAALDRPAVILLRLLAAAELDRHAHRMVRRLAVDPTRPGLEVDALVTIFEATGLDAGTALAALQLSQSLVRKGLVQAMSDDGPLLTQRLTLAPSVVAFLQSTPSDPQLGRLVAPLPVSELCLQAADVERTRQALIRKAEQLVYLVAPAKMGKETLFAALLAEHNCKLLAVAESSLRARPLEEMCRQLFCETLVHGAVVGISPSAVSDSSGPLFDELAATLFRSGLPMVVASASVPLESDVPHTMLSLALPTAETRTALLERLLPECDRLAELSSRFRLTPGRLCEVAHQAKEAALFSGKKVTSAELELAVSQKMGRQVSVLGTKIVDAQTWQDVVLPPETLDAVQEMISRARHRQKVMEEWGFERKLSKGVGLSALFAGPPGTGKTMLAGLIARELGLDLYQIDLSRVVSKYIGETEKNLAQVFDAAEGASVLLLFDEADSLFSKRTEVKSSNDRYSNLEINYLLQRMERFDGISILTTNLEGSIDPAFKRRLSFRVAFPLPDAKEREELWQRMLPKEAEVQGALHFTDLAQRYEFTGGNIRNAMLRAAFLAAGESRALSLDHIRRAIVLEYRDAGKLQPSGRLG